MASLKNYYQVLGVEAFADAETVRSAFRKLARQHHPDLNPHDKRSEERFKEINEAYEVLGNPDKKAMHDVALKAARKVASVQKAGPSSGQAAKGKQQADKGSAAGRKADATGQGTVKGPESQGRSSTESGQPKGSAESGSSGRNDSGNSSANAASEKTGGNGNPNARAGKPPEGTSGSGIPPLGEFFESFLKKGFGDSASGHDNKGNAGGGAEGIFQGARPTGEKPRRGEDVVVSTAISPQEASEGTVKTVNVQHNEVCRRCSGTGKVNGTVCTSCNGEKITTRLKKIDVRIPAGVRNGSRVRVAKEGGRGAGGADNGDLFLQIEIAYDDSLRIEGLDVYGEVVLSVTDAVLGSEIEVPTLNGNVKMTIPPGTQTGCVFRLKERGVQSGLAKGDHYVTVILLTPENLSSRERELYHELARLRPEKPQAKKPKS